MFHEYARKYLERMQAKAAEQGAGPPPPKRIVDKMLRNVWHVGYIQMVLPQACILQPVRHPLDVLLSCYKQPFEGRGTPWAWDLDGETLSLDPGPWKKDVMGLPQTRILWAVPCSLYIVLS